MPSISELVRWGNEGPLPPMLLRCEYDISLMDYVYEKPSIIQLKKSIIRQLNMIFGYDNQFFEDYINNINTI